MKFSIYSVIQILRSQYLVVLTYSQGNTEMYYKMQVTAPQNVGLEYQCFDMQDKTSNKYYFSPHFYTKYGPYKSQKQLHNSSSPLVKHSQVCDTIK